MRSKIEGLVHVVDRKRYEWVESLTIFLGEIDTHLPADTARMSSEARADQLAARYHLPALKQ